MKIQRERYADMYGPSTGDRIRLGDTDLFIEVEKDLSGGGDEAKFGGGKAVRDGMAQSVSATRKKQSKKAGTPDLVISNAVILDTWGIVKADIGIRDGKICAIGKAGNPDTMSGVHPDLVIGAGTEVMSAEGMILTAGGIDAHVHFIAPQHVETALDSGITTMIGGGTGPNSGTRATTCTPGEWNIHKMIESVDAMPMNFGFLGKGNCSTQEPLMEQVRAGAIGLKLHEDWGTTPKAIDTCLTVADKTGVQVAIHTDTLNEAGFVEDTIAAFKGRTIHTYHSEGAGGGHAPDILRVCAEKNVLPSSTNPTRPFTVNTIAEHRDMLMVCHHLDPNLPEDIAFADSRIRKETIAAEDILHDMGVISIISSDAQAMGRVGEVIIRTWQTAHKMKVQRGSLPEDSSRNDNLRAKRYVAKYTINAALAHGIDSYVGSVEKGKWADLVLWKPAFFGVKPDMIFKGGFVAWSQMGDANASIPTTEPVWGRPMFGGFGKAVSTTSLTFVSKQAMQLGWPRKLRLEKNVVPISNVRRVSKKDMVLNNSMPTIEVDPESFEVRADGKLLTCEPAQSLPLAQRYFLF